jgi:hypothetical protein
MPEAHAADYRSPTNKDREARDQTPGAFVTYSPREARSFRQVPTVGGPRHPGTMDDTPAYTAEHMSHGRADRRRVYDEPNGGGYPEPARESLRPEPEYLSAQTGLTEAISPALPPDRPRGGSTTADPARTATQHRWVFLRPFDQWASQILGGFIDKIEMPSPLASMPYAGTDKITHPFLYPGGGVAPIGRTSGVGIQPNSYRLIPRPWDEQLVNTPAPGTTAEGSRRAKGWRL